MIALTLFIYLLIDLSLSHYVFGSAAQVGFDPVAAAKTSKSTGDGAGGIPRQDLPGMLEKNILTEISLVEGKTSWQNRKAAMEVELNCNFVRNRLPEILLLLLLLLLLLFLS